jgi:hypothetical protein
MASNTIPKNRIDSADDLDNLSGYRGSIQGTALDEALDEHRFALWDAVAVIDSVRLALSQHFGRDWRAGVPNFERVLFMASRAVKDSADNLEAGTLEDRALEIARAKQSKQAAEVANV